MPKTDKHKFHTQKSLAKRRGIPFELTFEQWLDVWQASGKLAERGRKKGQYCMARKGDKGAYAVGNVEIILGSENSSVMWQNKEHVRERQSKAHLGQKAWNKGIPHSAETRMKIKRAALARWGRTCDLNS